MSTIDYHQWTDRVRRFSEGLRRLPGEINVGIDNAPPIGEEDLAAVSAKWSGGLPSVLRSLWREGAASINCRYSWTPPDEESNLLYDIFESQSYIYGGVRFEPAIDIFPGNSGVDPYDECMAEALGREGMDLWSRCAIFLHVGNGDCLALDPNTNRDDPAVVYLIHDEEGSGQISPRLSDFLTAWEELSYIGPEIWLLEYWLNRDRGEIDCTKHKTAELHK